MLTKSTRFWLVMIVGLSFLALGSACNKETPSGNNANAPSAGTPYQKTGQEGTIKGVISYTGTAPAPQKIDTSADPVCAQRNPNLETEANVVKDGKLANVFVYIKDGTTADGKKIGTITFETPSSAVTLDQNGCHYVPHVLGIQTNQMLKVTNSDPTQHNIHPQPKVNEEWNQTQANGAPPIEKKFTRAEVLIPVKCNQHPWMQSYIGVLKHPFFAVSSTDGSFTIKDVPPGDYTVVAWHEGRPNPTEKTMQVKVAANGSATANFEFGGASAANQKSSLEMMQAIEFPMLGRH
jgi:Polysaccharide lyase family 4, domain II